MDIILCHPFLQSTGGGDRVVLELAKKFNPKIYSIVYDKNKTFEEFKEFDIEILPPSILEKPFCFMKNDTRNYNAISAGLRYYFTKIKKDYDIICALGSPSEYIRNKNERVCWYCFSPNRQAYDLYDFRTKDMSLPKKIMNKILINTYEIPEHNVVPKIEQILTSSEVVKDRITKYLYRNDAKIISPGVDIKSFTNKGYEKYFFYPSRIVPEKQFEFAIESFRIFSEKHKDWKLIIGGYLSNSNRDKLYFEKIKTLSDGLNIEFKLNLTENELRELYANCYTVLFTAINEDFGLIPLEAMASEKPIISINDGGPKYTIINGKTGFLINSINEMSNIMINLSEHPNIVCEIGKNGRNHVLAHFTTEKFLNEMEHIFKRMSCNTQVKYLG